MKRILHFSAAMVLCTTNGLAQFDLTPDDWTIPVVEDFASQLDQTNSTNYSLIDMNGDGMPDMVDAQDNATGEVWLTASNVPYWKVYLNTGSGFGSATNWTIPVVEDFAMYLDQTSTANYSLIDMDGDGKPDMVDAQDNATGEVWLTGSNVPYWKVYLNTGSGFGSASNWTIPVVENFASQLDQTNGSNYSLVDMDGDGRPDMVDAQDNATGEVWLTGSNVPYWEVYLNTGSGFGSATNWTVPIVENFASQLDQTNGSNYSLVDMDGDGRPDMVDAQDNATGEVWLTGSNVPYWEVYLNTGSGFGSPSNWTIPVVEDFASQLDQTSSTNYSLIDINGDGKPDMVDAQDNATNEVWLTASNVPYWKMFINSGSGFASSADNWTIPVVEDFASQLDQTSSTNYSLVDMDGDDMLDIVDAQDNATNEVWLTGSNVPYWKVYLNTTVGDPGVGVEEVTVKSSLEVYPNPTNDFATINFPSLSNSVIEVYDGLGKLVYQETVEDEINSFNIDLTEQKSGIYIIRVVGDNEIQTTRVIKR